VGRIWRRQFLLAAGALAVAQVVAAQPQGKIPRVGFITYKAPTNPQERAVREAFFQGLRDNGFQDGRNVSVEFRYVEGHPERNARFAAEFVASKVEVIVAAGSSAARAAKAATTVIPVVFVGGAFPDRQGLVANLARPEGNVTGIALTFDDAGLRLMQLFKQIAPQRPRLAILWDPGNGGSALGYRENVTAARTLGLTPISIEVKSPDALEGALEAVLRERANVILSHTIVGQYYAKRIGEFAEQHRIPIVEYGPNFMRHGGVLGVNPDYRYMVYRSGVYTALVLKGTPPGELPVEQPSKFLLWVNLGTAKALGITVPQSILLQADQVIE
jgi:putative ABC transport system substrate-binding protein